VARRAALLLALAGCGTTVAERWDEVLGGEWILARIEGSDPLPGTEIWLTFATGRLYGRAANRYGAGFSRKEEAIEIGPIGSTRMHAPAPAGAMEQEERYLRLLAQIDGWDVSGERLDLLRGGTAILSFRRRSATPSRS
jgi:heat shock protein HslJ